MALYSAAFATATLTINAATWDLEAASASTPKLYEVYMFQAGALNGSWGFGRPANDGSVVQTSPVALLPEDPVGPAGRTTGATAWSVAPTVSLPYMRRLICAAAIGNGVIWTFARGLVLPADGGVALWNLASNPGLNVQVVVDE